MPYTTPRVIGQTRFHVTASKTRWVIGALVAGAVLVGVVVPLLRGQIVDTKEMDARVRLGTVRQALELYKKDHGAYPTEQQSLAVLCDQPSQRGYLVCKKGVNDPWLHPYVYKAPSPQNLSYQVYSSGPNGIDEGGGGDDITKPSSSR